jgi:hypothetical protein
MPAWRDLSGEALAKPEALGMDICNKAKRSPEASFPNREYSPPSGRSEVSVLNERRPVAQAPNELEPRISVIPASSCHFHFSFLAPEAPREH